jgi:hypothetical protein
MTTSTVAAIKIKNVVSTFNDDPFLVYHVQKETGYNYVTIKKHLKRLVNIGKLTYDADTRIYEAK